MVRMREYRSSWKTSPALSHSDRCSTIHLPIPSRFIIRRLPRTTGTTLPSLSAHPNPIQQSTIVLDNTTLPRSRNIVSTIQIAAAAANGNQISNVSKKRPETLFGPDVGGPASDEKGWLAGTSVEDTRKVSAGVADADTKATVSLDTVRQWVERAKKEEVSVEVASKSRLIAQVTHTVTQSFPGASSDYHPPSSGQPETSRSPSHPCRPAFRFLRLTRH